MYSSSDTAVPNLLGTKDRLDERQFFRRPWGRIWFGDDFKCITFTVHFIANLIPSLI